MDTKSRKFDRTWVTKTIAFLLAVLLAAFASVYTLKQAVNLEKDIDNAGAYVRDVLQGVPNNQVTKLTAFATKNQSLQNLAMQRYLLGDGSEQAYETYQKNKAAAQDAYRDSFVQTAVQNLLGKSGHGSPAAIGWYLSNGYITLEKLADHDRHYVSGSVDVNGGWIAYIDPDGDMTDYDMEYDNWDGDEEYEYTTTFYGRQDSDYSAQSSADIPKSVQKQLKDGQYAVELCNTNISDRQNGYVSYDGYYALTLNENKILTDFDTSGESSQLYVESFNSYANFRAAFESTRKAANAYKNMLFVVVDNDTGGAVSNAVDLDGKTLTKEDLRAFTEGKWHYSINLMTEEVTYSDAAQDAVSGKNSYLRQSMTYFLVPGVLNATMYVTFDEGLKKADAFTALLTDYNNTKTVLKTTLKVDLLCLLAILVCTVYLIIRAGRRHSDDELHMMRADKIFTLLRTILNLGAAVGFGGIAFAVLEYFSDNGAGAQLLMMIGVGGCAAAIAALLLDWLLYLTRHIKNGTLLKNFFIVWLFKKGKVLVEKIKAARAAKPQVVRDLLNDILRRVLLMGFLPNFILGLLIVILAGNQSFGAAIFLIFLIFVYDVFLALYICWYAFHLRTVIEAVHSMREGDMNVQIDTTRMPKPVKVFADDVMELQRGLQIAVNNALKDERMRTELITNVSHDLKTPLTSIINYVDLLSRCDIPDETAQQYIAVLGDKSARLKKLIEDLVEASKASSGAIRVDLVDMSLGELTNQIVGEYADAFEERNLDLIYAADSDVLVRADSKLCYRVLDNLMGNVKKYAMPGTRVYLDLTQTDTHGVLTLRNVSQSQLNIPVEELLERFVRADESRSTEGSGLGLSIADNLCRLQGAELRLSISGDLFTAEVAFPKA